jgi:hypothetical protein
MTYRESQIKIIKDVLAIAKRNQFSAQSRSKARQYAEDVEFWSNKLAFFENIKVGLFQDEASK